MFAALIIVYRRYLLPPVYLKSARSSFKCNQVNNVELATPLLTPAKGLMCYNVELIMSSDNDVITEDFA